MKKIYINRKHAKNPFTKISGIKAIELGNDLNCLIVEQERITRIPRLIQKSTSTKVVAAYLYLLHPDILISYGFSPLPHSINPHTFTTSEIKKVTHSCGFRKCVHPGHLQIEIAQPIANNGWGV